MILTKIQVLIVQPYLVHKHDREPSSSLSLSLVFVRDSLNCSTLGGQSKCVWSRIADGGCFASTDQVLSTEGECPGMQYICTPHMSVRETKATPS